MCDLNNEFSWCFLPSARWRGHNFKFISVQISNFNQLRQLIFFHMTQQSSMMILIHWLTLLQSTQLRPVCPHRPSKWSITSQTVIRHWPTAAQPMALQTVVSWQKNLKNQKLSFVASHHIIVSSIHFKSSVCVLYRKEKSFPNLHLVVILKVLWL